MLHACRKTVIASETRWINPGDLFLSLYHALRKDQPVTVAISLLLGCVGLTLFLSAPSFFSWLTLSDRFAAAMLLVAGKACSPPTSGTALAHSWADCSPRSPRC